MRLILLAALFFCSALGSSEPYAVVVIGGGPAGLACAIECTRTGYATILLSAPQEGIFAPPLPVTNWPGLSSSNWEEAIGTLQKSFGQYGGMYAGTRALSLKRDPSGFLIRTEQGALRAVCVVIATGRRPPPIPFTISPAKPHRVLSRLWDESFLTDKDVVAVIGTGPLATTCAIKSATRAKRVFLFRQPLSAKVPSEEALIQQFPKITRLYGSVVTGIIEHDEDTVVEYAQQGSKLVAKATWVVIANEWIPNSEIVRSFAPIDSNRAIIVQGPEGLTATPGLFACGEVSSTHHLPGIFASAEGVQTAQAVRDFLIERGILPTPPHEEAKASSSPRQETPSEATPEEPK